MAKIRMDSMPSMMEFLKANPQISRETAYRYQRAIKAARKAGKIVARELGGVISQSMEGQDIRLKDLRRVPFPDKYIQKLAMGWESMAENAYQVYTDRQRTYLTNLLGMMLDDDALYNSAEVDVFQDFLTNASDEQMAGFIKSMKGRGAYTLYNSETNEIAIDFSGVITAIHTDILGEKYFLKSSKNRARVDAVRTAMMRKRMK